MNCESALLAMNAAIDNELSDADRLILERHLGECPSCHEEWLELQNLNSSLRQGLRIQSIDTVIDRVMLMINEPATQSHDLSPTVVSQAQPAIANPIARPEFDRVARRRFTGMMTIFVLVLMLLVVSFAPRVSPKVVAVLDQQPEQNSSVLLTPNASPKTIAEVTYSTGSVELLRDSSQTWDLLNESNRISLLSRTRIRTGEDALCEIRTTSDALVRLNHGTELLLQEPEQLQLVSGELWCRAPVDMPLTISAEPAADHTSDWMNCFTCPSSSETQWDTKSDHDIRCLAVSPRPLEITFGGSAERCSMNPGEIRSFEATTNAKLAQRTDLLIATAWQLPLLILRNPDDRELRLRLTELLAQIGRTKMSYLYEKQIRQLGPAGTLPLLAYVQSADSKLQSELRQRAMGIISELAPMAATTELKQLLDDSDPIIRQLSSRTLQRLNTKE